MFTESLMMSCSSTLLSLARAVRTLLVGLILVVWGAAQAAPAPDCPETHAGITLPPGFCATIFADNLGHARHMAVSSSGIVYVNTWSGTYYNSDPIPSGGFLVALKDAQHMGVADVVKRFGETKGD